MLHPKHPKRGLAGRCSLLARKLEKEVQGRCTEHCHPFHSCWAHSARHNRGSVNAGGVEIRAGPIIRCKAIHNKLNVLCSRDSSRRPHHHPRSHREINGAGSSCRNQKQ